MTGRRRWAVWVAGLAVAGCARSFPPGWVYVTRVDRTAATVVWTGAAGGSAACRAADGHAVTAAAAARGRGLFAARVDGLRADTRYRCRVLEPDGRRITTVRFRTAGGPEQPFLFTVVGDSGHGGPVAKAIARRIRAAHPAFLIHVGDFAYGHGSVRQMAAQFFPPYRDTLRRVPLFPTPGNHDLASRSVYRDLFAPVAEGHGGDGFRYDFRWGPAAFVSLSSPDAAAGAPGLADDLIAGGARPWRIVFLHEPLFTAGRKRVEAGLRARLGPVVEAAGVNLVLAGHQHFYERSDPSCAFVPSARVHHVTSGGGSATQLDPVRAHPNFPRALAAPHFLRVRVRPDRITVRAVGPEGRTLDRMRIVRGVDPGCRADGWPRQRGRQP